MRSFVLGMAALLLGAGGHPAIALEAGPGRSATPFERQAIMMNGFYMGNLTSHWRIEPDGSGEYWRDVAPSTEAPTGRLEKYRGHLPQEQRTALLAALARFRSGAVRRPQCRNAVHDAPSLAIRWGAGPRDVVDVYLGCFDARSRAYARQVTELDAMVTRSFIRAGPAFAVEGVRAAPAY